jgi:hypothetical protein
LPHLTANAAANDNRHRPARHDPANSITGDDSQHHRNGRAVSTSGTPGREGRRSFLFGGAQPQESVVAGKSRACQRRVLEKAGSQRLRRQCPITETLMISLGHRVHMFAHPSTMERLRWCFDTVLGCGPEISLALPGLPDPVLAYRFPGGGSVSIEFTTDGLDEAAARRGAWLEIQADDPQALKQMRADARSARRPAAAVASSPGAPGDPYVNRPTVTTRGSTHVRTAFMGLTSSRGVTASGTLPTRTRPRPTIFLSTKGGGPPRH